MNPAFKNSGEIIKISLILQRQVLIKNDFLSVCDKRIRQHLLELVDRSNAPFHRVIIYILY